MKSITLETIYKKVTDLQRDIAQIKKSLLEEPELREDFILRMRDIDLERSIMIDDFENRYGLQYCINLRLRKVLTRNLKGSRRKTKRCYDLLIEKSKISWRIPIVLKR